jgi:hypothetical protein
MNPLRNANINYFNGWFFVTFQVAKNKTVVASDTRDDWSKETPHLRAWQEFNARGASNLVRETPPCVPLISTFTGFEGRGVLERRLEKRRPFVWVSPSGIRDPLPSCVATACTEGWGFVISPVP